MTSSGKPIINEFNDQRFHIALARSSGSFEFTYTEIGHGTTSVTGDMEIAFTALIRMGRSARDRGSRHGLTRDLRELPVITVVFGLVKDSLAGIADGSI